MNVSEVAEPAAATPVGPLPPGGHRLTGRLTAPGLVVGVLMLIGVAIRLVVAHQSLFADELSTYWIISAHGLGGVISTVHGNAEITPPLYFVASWLTTQFGHAPELVRAPSLLAGASTIPVVYRLGTRTVGRPAALVACALTALSPFMIYYSGEARGYGVMMLLVTSSTLAMLVAIETRRARWWVLYAVCSCAAFYTHYTSAFVLGTQFLWLVWAHPEALRPALLANVGAVAALLPWTTGLINDFTSPTTKILSALSPFTAHDVRLSLEHWVLGYPYTWVARLPELPGRLALALLGLVAIIVVAGIGTEAYRERPRVWLARFDRRVVLVFALLLSVPLGEAIVSALSTHLFGVRNLAAAWPALALSMAVVLIATGRRLRFLAAALTIAVFALGAGKLLAVRYQRPDYHAAAEFIDHHARSGDVVIDETGVLSPGPFTSLDVELQRPIHVFRAGAPAERDHPFGFSDPIVPLSETLPKALAAAHGGRIFLVATVFPSEIAGLGERTKRVQSPFPPHYRLVEAHGYPGIAVTAVEVYANRTSPRG